MNINLKKLAILSKKSSILVLQKLEDKVLFSDGTFIIYLDHEDYNNIMQKIYNNKLPSLEILELNIYYRFDDKRILTKTSIDFSIIFNNNDYAMAKDTNYIYCDTEDDIKYAVIDGDKNMYYYNLEYYEALGGVTHGCIIDKTYAMLVLPNKFAMFSSKFLNTEYSIIYQDNETSRNVGYYKYIDSQRGKR